MEKEKQRFVDENGLPVYFDMQAEIGHTKHIGGSKATDQLLEMCELQPGQSLLNVGCGAGASSVYIYNQYACQVTAVDFKENMVESARKTARRRGLEGKITFRQADAQDLPFEDNSFDVVICESVNIFVPDRLKALGEYKRVLKPGGRLGLNEPIWVKQPSPELAEMIERYTGYDLALPAYWEEMLRQAEFSAVQARACSMSMREESASQMGFFTFGDTLRLMFKSIGVILGSSFYRNTLKEFFTRPPKEYPDYMGYGLFCGQKEA